MHLQASGAHKKAWPPKGFVLGVVAQHVTNVLAKKTFDALAKFLHAVDVALVHFPFDAGLGLKGWNFLVYFVIPRNVGDQILDDRKSLERRDGDGFIERQRIQTGL